MSGFVNKYEIQKNFFDWISGFPDDQRFEVSINWETSICISTGKKERKSHDPDQTHLDKMHSIDKDRDRARKRAELADKEARQGRFTPMAQTAWGFNK